MSMPAWLSDVVFYEVYPQSFKDTNSDGIGDLPGLISKLDYIKDLGCNGIWLNPCFESTFFDAGYDVVDYKKVAPRYGTNEDLKNLFDECHKRDMHVILDLVPGHTSVYHKWFRESIKAKPNEMWDRYVWTDDTWHGFDNVGSITGFMRGSTPRNGCVACNYYTVQPALNYGFAKITEPWMQPVDAPGPMATREAMKDIMRFWMSMGCDGFRVDMAGSLIKNDEGREETIKLWQDFRRFMDTEFPNCAILSEWGNPAQSLRGGFHMDFLMQVGPSHYMDLFRVEEPFFSRRGKGDISEFVKSYKENMEATGGKGLMCIPSSNHDMTRIREKLDSEEVKLAFAFLLSVPGAPFVYYGDEIGMRYLAGIDSVEGGFERTGTRSPMQWDRSANAGFSTAVPEELYIPLDTDPNRPTVADQLADPNSLLNEVKKLNALRHAHTALQNNSAIEFVYAEPNAYPFVYKRSDENEAVLVVLNPSDREVTCEISVKDAKCVLHSNNGAATLADGKLTVPAASATFFQL